MPIKELIQMPIGKHNNSSPTHYEQLREKNQGYQQNTPATVK